MRKFSIVSIDFSEHENYQSLINLEFFKSLISAYINELVSSYPISKIRCKSMPVNCRSNSQLHTISVPVISVYNWDLFIAWCARNRSVDIRLITWVVDDEYIKWPCNIELQFFEDNEYFVMAKLIHM